MHRLYRQKLASSPLTRHGRTNSRKGWHVAGVVPSAKRLIPLETGKRRAGADDRPRPVRPSHPAAGIASPWCGYTPTRPPSASILSPVRPAPASPVPSGVSVRSFPAIDAGRGGSPITNIFRCLIEGCRLPCRCVASLASSAADRRRRQGRMRKRLAMPERRAERTGKSRAGEYPTAQRMTFAENPPFGVFGYCARRKTAGIR
jgi:hypothetical protein